GLWQTAHCSVARSRCFAQNFEAAEASWAGAAAAGAGAASCEIFKRGAAAGGGGGGGGGVVCSPNCCRTSSLTKAEASRPQAGQTNFTGFCSISGVASKTYFAPQEHCSFMVRQGLGFNNTIPGFPASENGSCDGLNCMLPSHMRKFPP